MRAPLLPAAIAVAALFGCSAEIEPGRPSDRVGRTIQPIVGGVPSGAERDAVVVLARFENGVRNGLCSATLVAPNLLLTARHCVSETDAAASCLADGSPAVGALLHGDVPASHLAVFAAKDGVVAPVTDESKASAHGVQIVVDDAAKTICNDDLAFVVIDTPLDAPYATLRVSGGPAYSERVTVVGFGVTDGGALPAERRERASVALIGSGPMLYPDDPRFGIGSGEFMIGESACLGDSGGPAFTRGGVLVGVASRVGNGKPRDANDLSATCTGEAAHAIFAHLGQAKALVARAFAAASNVPIVEETPLGVSLPNTGDPGAVPVGADRLDPAPAPPEAQILRAKATVDAPVASVDGGCATSPGRRRAGGAWLVGVALASLARLRAKRRAA